jgi:hypothetical protein
MMNAGQQLRWRCRQGKDPSDLQVLCSLISHSFLSGKAGKAQFIDEIEVLDMNGQELRKMLAAAQSGEMTEVPGETENVHDSDPVTTREVAVTASYYTFIPAAKDSDLHNSNIVNLDATLAGVVRIHRSVCMHICSEARLGGRTAESH